MKVGKLYYDGSDNRLDIKFEDGTYYGGLHCGETLEYLKDNSWTLGKWLPTRIEYDHSEKEWYLVGLYGAGEIPTENTVRK